MNNSYPECFTVTLSRAPPEAPTAAGLQAGAGPSGWRTSGRAPTSRSGGWPPGGSGGAGASHPAPRPPTPPPSQATAMVTGHTHRGSQYITLCHDMFEEFHPMSMGRAGARTGFMQSSWSTRTCCRREGGTPVKVLTWSQ